MERLHEELAANEEKLIALQIECKELQTKLASTQDAEMKLNGSIISLSDF